MSNLQRATIHIMPWVLLVLFLTSCAPMQFAKPGATEKELQYDSYECNRDWERTAGAIAFHLDPMGNAYYGFQSREWISECLMHKGWKRVDG